MVQCHILSLRIHYAESLITSQAVSIFPRNSKVCSCTKAQGKCSMDLAINVKATCYPIYFCQPVELSRHVTIRLYDDGHWWTFAYILKYIYQLLCMLSVNRALASIDIY